MTLVIGIIGPPCSGKSTVAETIVSRGGIWLNADAIAKSHLQDADVVQELVAKFGSTILDDAGQISRPMIANLVFGDDEVSRSRLGALEEVLHPRTRQTLGDQLDQAIAQNAPIVILDVPLLLEVGWDKACDEVWCISVTPAQHQQLLAARGWDTAELERRQRNQLPIETKKQRATRIINNEGTAEELMTQTNTLIDSLAPGGS